jgi:hypothetical protein
MRSQKLALVLAFLTGFHQNVWAADLFESLSNELKKMAPQNTPANSDRKNGQTQNNTPRQGSIESPVATQNSGTPAAGTASQTDTYNSVCKAVFGKPFKQRKVGSPEDRVKKYFKVGPDFEKVLYQGINRVHSGTLISLSRHIDDIKEKTVKNMAESFVSDPSVSMLAQVVEYAENGDKFIKRDSFGRVTEQSERAEAQTLLAMILMQYPEYVANKDSIMSLLKVAAADNTGESTLGATLIARAYMFGDYAPKNMNEFGNRITSANTPEKGIVKLAADSAYFALEKMPPGWSGHENVINWMQQRQDVADSFNQQKAAAASKKSDINDKALKLMEEGEKIDVLTLEALGAGPKIAEIRAKGEMLSKEASGEANIIKVKVFQSELSANLIKDMVNAGSKLDEDAKAKLAKANQIRLDNTAAMRNVQIQVVTQFFNGDMGELLLTGPLINQYYKTSCKVLYRQLEVSKLSGAPIPQKTNIELAKDL